MHTVRIPGGRKADILQAARFEVEDDLSEPVESLHVVAEKSDAGNGYELCLVSQSVMSGWVRQIEDARLENARIVPDASLLADDSPPMDMGDRILISQDGRRLAVDKSLPVALLDALMQNHEAGISVVAAPLQFFSDLVGSGRTGIDLRQGEYARKAEAPIAFNRLKLPLGLAAAVALAWVGYTAAEVYTVRKLETTLDNRSAMLFSQAYPGGQVPANMLTAVRDRTASADAGNADFRQMAAVMYDALSDTGATALSSLRFDGDAGQMRIVLVYSAFGDDQVLKTSLERLGFDVRLGETRVENGLVVGDMTLEWLS